MLDHGMGARPAGEGGPTHLDDTIGGVLQLRWRTIEAPDCWTTDSDEEAERKEQSSPTFDLQ